MFNTNIKRLLFVQTVYNKPFMATDYISTIPIMPDQTKAKPIPRDALVYKFYIRQNISKNIHVGVWDADITWQDALRNMIGNLIQEHNVGKWVGSTFLAITPKPLLSMWQHTWKESSVKKNDPQLASSKSFTDFIWSIFQSKTWTFITELKLYLIISPSFIRS